MEEKELFSAVRDEYGDLAIHFPGSAIAITLEKEFWKDIIARIEESLKNENAEYFSREDILPLGDVIKTIKRCFKDWQD